MPLVIPVEYISHQQPVVSDNMVILAVELPTVWAVKDPSKRYGQPPLGNLDVALVYLSRDLAPPPAQLLRNSCGNSRCHEAGVGPSGFKVFSVRSPAPYVERLYVIDDGDGGAFLSCGADAGAQPFCRTFGENMHGVAVDVRFSETHLQDWPEIQVRLRALIGSFVK
ncbi:hypothetical protein [Roseiterribacter gracilis]|uniref:hypothetical protein n=1 Tax=Roseiterribacter gracilis TaxID=2812848 RepID=UPI003B43A3D8